MKLERILWSNKSARLNMTVFTTLTVDRLAQLKVQCLSFKGPLSASVFLGLIQDNKTELASHNVAKVKDAVMAVDALHAE